jgi:hypothetical protein
VDALFSDYSRILSWRVTPFSFTGDALDLGLIFSHHSQDHIDDALD